jgi:phosphatidate phosphatase PAH1
MPKKPAKAAKDGKTPAPVEKRPAGRPSAPVEKKPNGRPSSYTKAIADEICERLAHGESLHSICKSEHMPSKTTVLRWAIDDVQGFKTVYAHAREIQLGVREDELFDIVDDSTNDWIERESKNGDVSVVPNREHIDRTRLRVETRKWVLTKLRPDRFGDKIEQTHKSDEAFLQLWQGMSGGKPRSD